MTDYGHPITFGLSLYPSVDLLRETKQLAQAADAAGLEYLAIQDHAYNPELLDVWTLITYLVADTERISFFPDVADLQLRPPTILAKAAASLSVLTGAGSSSASAVARPLRASPPWEASGATDARWSRSPTKRCRSCAGRWRAAASSFVATSTRSAATQPGRCPRLRSRFGWAARSRGCSPSPDAPATAGSHR